MTKRFFSQLKGDITSASDQTKNGKNYADINLREQFERSEPKSSTPPLPPGGQRRVKQPNRRQSRLHLNAKVTAIAIAVGMLPVLAIGTATYYLASGAITDQATQARRSGSMELAEAESMQQRQLQLLGALLAGTGATALLSGGLAAFWLNRSIGSAVTAARAAGHERAVRTQLFTDAVYQIRASLNQEDILKAAVEESRKVMAADRVIVYSLDENSMGMVIAESVDRIWPRALRARIDDPCFAVRYTEKYQNGRVHAIDDIYEEKLTPCYIEQLETFAVRANLVAPLLNEKKLVGLLIAHQCSGPRVWQQAEIDLFTQIATQVGFALDNAKLLAERANLAEQLETESKWKELFADATRHIHASLSEEDVLQAAVEEARRVLAADRVLVYSTDRKSQGIVLAESVAYGWPRALGVTIVDPCFAARYIDKYENGRVRALNNIYEAGMTQCYIEQLETLAVKANLVAPVLHEGKLLGLLVAHQCSSPRVWQPLEIKWFSQIATQVGFAFDNVKLIKRVEQMAEAAQFSADARQQERALVRQRIAELLRDSEAAFTAFSADASRQAEMAIAAVTQIQAIADAARCMASNAQKSELQLQQTTGAIQAGHETVNLTVDTIAANQETVAEATMKAKHLGENAYKLSQFVSLIKDLVAQMNRQAINATIESGRNGDAFQHSVVLIAEAVRSLTQQLTKAAIEIEPVIAQLATETEDLAAAMETETEQVNIEMELTLDTRQKLNQLATVGAKLNTLVSHIAEAAADQSEKSTAASQTFLEVATLANHTSEQSALVVESFTKLAAISQEL